MSEIIQNTESEIKELFVDFRLKSDFLDPEIITSEFGIQPAWSFAKGEKYLGKEWDPVNRKTFQVWRQRPWGIWAITSKTHLSNEMSMEQHICYLLDMLEPKKEQIEKYLKKKGDYFISFYLRWNPYGENGGYDIQSDTFIRMANISHYTGFSFIASERDVPE